MEILREYGIDPAGKHCVVVGRSHIVGRPMSMLMLHANATVTICHSHTRDLSSHTRQADILVAAVGRERFITADMVGEGAVVIDVGMNRDAEGKLCGDVDFAGVEPKVSAITPVPVSYTHLDELDGPGGLGGSGRHLLERLEALSAHHLFPEASGKR